MPGEAGAEGEQAVQGPDVEAGAEDEAGADGIQGMPGEAGTEGEQAVQGPDVEAGADGIQGPEGDLGDTGDQGSQGEVGDDGAQRPTFAKVVMADDGDAGEPGELIVNKEARKQGDKGDLGETGIEGQTGETRPQGEEEHVGHEGEQGQEVASDPPEMSTSEGELTAKEDNITPEEAVKDGNLEKLKELLEQQEDVIELVVGEKLLFIAAEWGHLEILKFLLKDVGVDKNSVDEDGWNVLHWTGDGGNIDCMRYLIETCQMNVESVTKKGHNVLHLTGREGSIDCMKYLIETCQMNVESVNKEGYNVLHLTGRWGKLDCMRYLIETCQMNVGSVTKKGYNVLHWTGWGGSIDCMRYLIETCQMNVESVTKEGYNVLHWTGAVGKGDSIECMKYLIENCRMDLSCTVSDDNGHTMCHLLSLHGHMTSMQFLLDNYEEQIDIDKKNKLGCSALDIAIEQQNGAMVKLLIKYGANIKSVISNITKMYILRELEVEDISFTEILIDRVYTKMKKETDLDPDEMKQIMTLIQMEVDCSKDVNLEKLSTEHSDKLKKLCSLKNVREYNHYAVIVKMMEIANPEKKKKKSGDCFSKIKEGVDNLARGCYTNTIGRYMRSHIDSCKMISWLTLIFSLFFIGIHIGDIVSDFKIGFKDSRNLEHQKIRALGIFEITLAVLCLFVENIQSAYSLFRDEKLRLSLVKKKSKLDLVQSDWDTLNYSEQIVYQILFLAFWPFKIRDQCDKLLIKSILFNILSLLQLRPVVDRLRPIFHDSSSRHWVYISEANTKFLQQGYVVFEQIPEFLIQVYTLHMALSSDDEHIMGRLISLLMPILTIPRGIISFEECIRKIDPRITELGNSKYILLVSHILTIPGRLFLLSSVMFLSDKPYVIGYIILRIGSEFILNIASVKQLFAMKAYKYGKPLDLPDNVYYHDLNLERFKGKYLPKNNLIRRIKFLFRLLMCSIRDVFIVSIRSAEGYMQPPVNVTNSNKSIRSNRNILSRYFVMILESIAMTLLIESFYNPEDNKKIKYKHGIWIKDAAWIVTILLVTSTTIVYLIINFIHHERLLKSLKEYFKWRIAKSFIGGLIIVISLMSIKQHYFGSSIPILYYYFTGCSIYLIVLAFSIILSNSMFSEILEKCKATSLRVVGPQW